MANSGQRREYTGLLVGLVGVGIAFFGFFATGANLGLSLFFETILEQPSLLVSLGLTFGGFGVFLLGKRIATKNGEYESYWFG